MDLSVRTEGPWAPENFSWLGSKHGVEATDTITLDKSTFASASYYAGGYIPSGVTLGKITASGRYGPYDDTASDGRQVMVGHLLTSKSVVNVGSYLGASIFRHGKVYSANLPTGHGLDSAGQTDVGSRIIYL